METERLMQAVLQSFIDADLRVEVLPRPDDKSAVVNSGSGPSRGRSDATTQSSDGRGQYMYKHPRPETIRLSTSSAAPEHADGTAQAVDGRYATVYKVHHCKMTPTSPPLMTSEFPPQRPDVSYGGDNFQVGGTGSGETRNVPVKTSCYRGAGLNWPNREAVCAPRMSRCTDSFASSLRKYPSMSPERSSEVFERLINYSMPRASQSPRSSPHMSPRRSPTREPISFRNPKVYEETYAANSRPRAPEDCPTRDRREDLRKHIKTKQGDIRLIREVSRRLRKTLKSISSYSPTRTLTSGCNQEWCDTPIPETSETDHEDTEEPRAVNHPVNSTVQAVAATSSLGVETKVPSKRTIAVPVSPSPSSGLSSRAHNLTDSVVTRSVQTFEMPRRSVDTITSITGLTKYDSVKVVVKKSKSLSDFRLNRDFKSEILTWLDEISDPKIKNIQDTVLRNLSSRLKGMSMTGDEKIKVKLGNCLKHRIDSKQASNEELIKKHEFNSNTQSQGEFTAKDSRHETDQNVYEEVIKDWLGDISIKKRDIFLRPVQKVQIYNTFVNRLKHFVFGKSKNCRKKLLREEILEILEEVPIEVNGCDKTDYISRITDALVYKLDNILQDQIKTKHFRCNMPNKSSTNLQRNSSPRSEEETKDIVFNAMVEVLKKRNSVNPNMIKKAIVDLVDMLMNSVKTNIGLEEIASVLHNATKLSEKEAFQFATQLTENCVDLNKKKYATMGTPQPLAVFMVHHLSRNYVTKTSGTNMSRHSIGSIVDKNIEDNLNQYKTKLVQQIDRWLSHLAVLRASDTNFRQAVVLDLASDIVDRQKYLEFNKDRGTYTDELEHLKYQIFKWIKRYVGEDNMEALEQATELMELIRNIPVPKMNRSQYHLYKSNSGLCFKDSRFEPCTSTDISNNNVYGSKSDSGICNRESRGGLVSTNVRVKKDDLQKQKLQCQKSSTFNRWNVRPNLSSTSVNDNPNLLKRSLNNLNNSCETCKPKETSESINSENNINKTVQNKTNQPIGFNRRKHISQDIPVSTESRDNLCRSDSAGSCRNDNFESVNLINASNDILNSKSNSIKCNEQESRNGSVLTNYVVHKVSSNKTYDVSKRKHKTPSALERKNNTANANCDSLKRSEKYKRKSQHKLNRESDSESKMHSLHHSENTVQNSDNGVERINEAPGPSGLITPVPTYSDKPSSAAAKLMADWRPPPVFTPPPPGRPLINQVQEDFQEYLKNWCQQIPIPSNTPEEIKIAEKARLGILNGIWKIITKIKTQPAVFQNKFYYEDVLGKEIDELLDCLPQTEELQEKRYALKAQLLEKNSDMNDLIKELEMPENYKQLVTDKEKRLEDEKFRKSVRTNLENPTKMFEEMLMYCTLADFLKDSNYKETDKISAKAYKNKLLKTIQAYMDRLKKSYGKEIENLLNVYTESDIFDVLYKVPLPTEDSIKENADEILLGLEIEDWMKHLPLVRNDDGNEQIHRIRLRDALTKKIHELTKRDNFTDCCGDTQVRHEISFFLDKVPLEKDQDLKINEMVDELTNRLKSRHGTAGRRKSVAFQDGHQNQSIDQSNRLLNRSQLAYANKGPERLYSTGNEDAEYRNMFQNAPLCSTRIEQADDGWAIEDDQDAQYRALFKDKPACSSMIEPQGYGPQDNASVPPDYPVPYNQDPYFVYSPGQFHESARGGAFGFSQRGLPPQVGNRFQYPNLMTSRRGSPQSRQFESEADFIPNASLPDNPYQSARGPHSFVSALDADQAPPMMRRPSFNPPPPPERWEDQNEASGFVTMVDHGPPRPPQMQMSGHYSNGRPPYNSHHSQIDPNMSRGLAAGFDTSVRNHQPLMDPASFIPNESRLTRTQNASKSNRIEIDPSMMRQDPLEVSVHEDQRISRSRAAISHRQDPDMLQAGAENEFVSMASHQPPGAMSTPFETSARNQSFRQVNQPSLRITPAPHPEFRRSTDREGIQEIINQNRSANRSGQEVRVQGPSQAPQSRQASTRDQVPSDRFGEAVSGPQSSPQRSERRYLAANAPSSEISNQPAFYSTPDQRASQLAPPNIRERRQIEKERVPARRLDMNTEDNEGEERCHCRERFKRWNSQGQNCTTCEECLHGHRGFYTYPYPYPYPYVPFGRPPYPPHCRR